jgi:hypothetical protein
VRLAVESVFVRIRLAKSRKGDYVPPCRAQARF